LEYFKSLLPSPLLKQSTLTSSSENYTMALTYFEHVEFYHKLVTPSLEAAEQLQDGKLNPILANEASDTTICVRIRPLAEEEKKSQHILGVVPKESSKAILFEPRMKFDSTPDATVSFSTQI
jgi:hypothetical protein